MSDRRPSPEIAQSVERRRFLAGAAAGTLVYALGGEPYALAGEDDPRTKQIRPDGRPRLPPGQRLIDHLKPMGGDAGDADPKRFHLRVHGEVDQPLDVDYAALLAMPTTEQTCDVHCVTGWSAFDVRWTGVRVAHLAKLARVRDKARYVIFEAAFSYTTNVRIADALAPTSLVAYKLNGTALPRANGPPVRGVVPELYFWKSAKWIQGIYFSARDEPGYWEMRGYHNHADPWKEERYG